MPELSQDNPAHVSIYFFLRVAEHQTDRPFAGDDQHPGAGTQRLRDLLYYNSAATPALLRQIAAMMAHKLVLCIETYYTRQREDDYADLTLPELVAEFANLLVQGGATVYELAEKADTVFRYRNEKSAVMPIGGDAL